MSILISKIIFGFSRRSQDGHSEQNSDRFLNCLILASSDTTTFFNICHVFYRENTIK